MLYACTTCITVNIMLWKTVNIPNIYAAKLISTMCNVVIRFNGKWKMKNVIKVDPIRELHKLY